MTTGIQHFGLFLTLSWVLIVTPGPDVIYVLTRGISQGRRAGLISACGITLGTLVHTLFAALGLSIILQTSAVAFTAVKMVGAIYLVYLGIQALRSKSEIALGNVAKLESRKLFTQGLISNTLNPKVALFFMAFLPQFVSEHAKQSGPALSFIFLGLVFACCGFLFLATLGFFAGTAGQHLLRNRNISKWIQSTSGTILILLGIRLGLMKQGE